MTLDGPIPTSYAQWRECIEVHCGIPLTPDYVHSRIGELEDSGNRNTKHFEKLYGAEHLERTLGWFRRAADELG